MQAVNKNGFTKSKFHIPWCQQGSSLTQTHYSCSNTACVQSTEYGCSNLVKLWTDPVTQLSSNFNGNIYFLICDEGRVGCNTGVQNQVSSPEARRLDCLVNTDHKFTQLIQVTCMKKLESFTARTPVHSW